MLNKYGYVINKNEYNIEEIKNELTVKPVITFNTNIPVESFKVFKETDEQLILPKYYGLEKFGKPLINNELTGQNVDIKFIGNLRQPQIEIIKEIMPKLEKNDGGLLCLGCGQGKCLAKDTLILMYDGTLSKVQNIKIGDKIMGDDSTPRNILSIAHGREMMYKIKENKSDEYYIVNESHILSLKYNNQVIDISLKEYLEIPKIITRLYSGYRVPIIFSEYELEIEPYVIGKWLFTFNHEKKQTESECVNEFFEFIKTFIVFKSTNIKNQKTYCHDFLKKYNLINNKHIPLIYKCNSNKNQMLLLNGIIDSGSDIKNNKRLLKDLIFLTRSLGFKIKNDKILIKKNILTYKITVEKLQEDDYYGFEIDGNRRFVLGDFTVTHNTVISLYVASVLKVKTLVIVHKSFLLNQWKLRAQEFTNAKIGIIQRDKIDIDNKEIVIGMLQSIAKDKYGENIFKDFGLVIFDEAHHAPSKYFSRALPIIACKKTLALSATPNRSDKLEKVLYWYFGNIIYKAPMEQINNVIVKMIKYTSIHKNFKEYKLNYGTDINRPKTINKLVEIEFRNNFIIEQIRELLLEDERKLLILSDRVEHLNVLKTLLNISDSGFYIGGMKQKSLDESEKNKVIFATYGMASEALDIPDLNTLLMVTPRKEIEQAVGRITRKKNHPVQPVIIDIIDQLPSFTRLGYCRKKFYNLKGFKIKYIEVLDNKILNEIEEKTIEINNNTNDFID